MKDIPKQQPKKMEEEDSTPPPPRRTASAGSSSVGGKKVPSYLQGTRSSRIRSQSLDKKNNNNIKPPPPPQQQQQPNTPSRSTNLDPTGMFRNRGRRVINTSMSSPPPKSNTKVAVVTAQHSSHTQQPQQTTIILSSNANNNVNGKQRDQRTQQLAKEYLEKYGNGRSSSSRVVSVDATQQNNDGDDDDVGTNNDKSAHDEIIESVAPSANISQAATVADETVVNECDDKDDDGENNDEHYSNGGEIEQNQLPNTAEAHDDPINNNSVCDDDDDDDDDDKKNEFVPTITLESLQRFQYQDNNNHNPSNQLQTLCKNNVDMIKQSLSNDSNDSEQCHSAIGSTVSVMGSIVGEGDHSGSFGYDESRLLSVKRRMMQDVEEIAEVDEDEDDDGDDTRDDENDRPKLTSSLLNSLSGNGDDVTQNDNDLNKSMECNAEETRNEESIEDNVQSNNNNDDDSEQVADNATNNGGTANVNKVNNVEAANEIHDESPLRAAFRRKTKSMTSSLPRSPLPHLSALAPNRFHSSYAKTEHAVANGLKIAQHCFSFEDTTIDDSNFLIMPESQQQTTHKYYGLSGAASFDNDYPAKDRNIIPRRNKNDASDKPSNQLSSSKKGARPKWYPPMSGGGTVLSPKVIRHRQVLDDNPSPISSFSNNGHNGIRLSASFDPMATSSPSRIDTKMKADRNEAVALLRSIVMQLSQYEKEEETMSLSESLYCQSCQMKLGKEAAEKPSSIGFMNCPSCSDRIKVIANSMKQTISENEDVSEDENDMKSAKQSRDAAIDALVQSHEYAFTMKQSALLASKWLESIDAEGTVERTGVLSSSVTDHIHARDGTVENLEEAMRVILSKQEQINRLNYDLAQSRAEIGRLKCPPRKQQQVQTLTPNKSILSDSSSDVSDREENQSLNLTSPFPTIKYCDSHDESYIRFEKRIEADMNLENRKEIIFLKAALEKANKKIAALERGDEVAPDDKEEPFQSEIDAIEPSKDAEGNPEELFMKIAESIENVSVASSSLAEEEEEAQSSSPAPVSSYSVSLDDPVLEKELEEYRTALIETLRVEEINKSRTESSGMGDNSIVEKDLSKSILSDATSDKKMVNVRMIDGENFTTEWGDLDLPPPPDHGLKSPIVDAILSKWTDDSSTQSALIKWIEEALDGNVSDAPSLKLSGLDHQIKDGFIMHVLPLLLLRKDIHIHVTSRAHRHTTYDIAVSISQSVQTSPRRKSDHNSRIGESAEQKHHLLAYQATHNRSAINSNGVKDDPISTAPFSARQFLGRAVPDIVRTASHTESISTAVTTQISNKTPTKKLFRTQAVEDTYTAFSEMNTPNRVVNDTQPALGDDLSVGGSSGSDDDSKGQRQSSIMGSLSGAFGGLLSRRKGPHSYDLHHQPSSEKSPNTNASTWSPPAFFTPQPNHSREELRQDDIYHRVVSAPPGKIGLTFVEYEGNTMVSNVAESSPLSGWVFPSDVLVAIDDTPVRGLRTREIVQLLTEKKGQQRNLRMYSLNHR